MENQLKLLITESSSEFDKEGLNILEKNNYKAIFCEKNSFEILKTIEKEQPDIVILDLFIPNLDAIEIIKSVRENKNILEIPFFIVISNYNSDLLKKEALSAGADCFEMKPYNLKNLLLKTREIIIKKKIKMPLARNLLFNSEQNIEIKVTEVLHQIGVPAHIKGYNFLRTAIMISMENPEIINTVTRKLYPSVAGKFSTTPSRVERAIRHAIEVAWDRGDIDILNSYFGYTIHNGRGKPTNSEFIAMIADKMRLQVKNVS